MTNHLYDKLTPGGKRLARIPRFGRLIARMSDDRLQRLTTEASTYWEVFSYVDPQHDIQRTGVIDSGLERGASNLGYVDGDPPINREDYGIRLWQRNLAMAILGAIAFEMYVRGDEKPLDRVEGNLTEFKQAVINRCVNAGCYIDENADPINKKNLSRHDWLRIRRLDVTGLQNLLFSSFPAVDENTAGGERILFTDITVQAFFAAYWATRWATDDDRIAMRDWIPDPWLETNMPYNEYWTLAAELPNAGIDTDRWQAMFAPLYDWRLQPNQEETTRSCELIYRSWNRMGHHEAQKFFCREFETLLNGGNETAQRILHTSDGETQFVVFADASVSDQNRSNVKEFWMGTANDRASDRLKPKHLVRFSRPFLVRRRWIVNAEFELFGGRWRKLPADNLEFNRSPVVDVSWYDAWCFAKWWGKSKLIAKDMRCVSQPKLNGSLHACLICPPFLPTKLQMGTLTS